MNYYILFNPKSRRGKTAKNISKLEKYLVKKGHQVKIESLLDIKNAKEYINNLNVDDKIIIYGGDGTLHYLANELTKYSIKQEMFIVRNSGSGNDFLRSVKTKDKLIKINKYLEDIPYEVLDDKKKYFVNSVGMGLDALVCKKLEDSRENKSKDNYFKNALKAIKEAKTYDLTLNLDGKTLSFNKVWFVVVCNGPYFGGGMKISPKSKRLDDKLEVVVVNNVKRWLLLLIFPTIYLGIHKIFKRYVHFYEGKNIVLESNTITYAQYDGEAEFPKSKLEIKR